MPDVSFQTSLVALVQRWLPPLGTELAQLLSALGGEWFYLLLIPALLCFGRWETAVKAARVMVLADLVGEAIKWTLRWPRPEAALARAVETSPGFVSTHAALSLGVGLVLGASYARLRPWLALWVLGVAWSRLALGVHFPLDILGGWLVGGLIALAVLRYGEDSRRGSHLCLGFALLLMWLWPAGGTESLQRDLGLVIGLESALLLRLGGRPSRAAPSPLSLRQGGLRLLLLLTLYLGLKLLPVARLLRYLALGLVAAWRGVGRPGPVDPPAHG